MPRKKKPAKGSAFLLSTKECAALRPPHRRQLVVHDVTGTAQVCLVCGAVISRTRAEKPKRGARSIPSTARKAA